MQYDYLKMVISLRNKLVLSQEEMAKKLGVSFASVNRWETGRNQPTIKAKRKIIDLCKKMAFNFTKKKTLKKKISKGE